MAPEGIQVILEKHKKWLQSEADGQQADLRGADLSRADLRGADLSEAYLSRADLRGADLSEAYLSEAYLSGADLSWADLRGADLRGADLSGADLRGADLSWADLSWADLSGADLSGAYLSRAYLSRADLPEIPAIPDLKAKILSAIGEEAEHLNMSSYHGKNACGTTHCLAGWATTIAGDAGLSMEEKIGVNAAGALIFHASIGEIPDFYSTNEAAIAWLKS